MKTTSQSLKNLSRLLAAVLIFGMLHACQQSYTRRESENNSPRYVVEQESGKRTKDAPVLNSVAEKYDYIADGEIMIDMDEPQPENFNTEEYDKIEELNFQSPIHAPLSTFSVDVDRASYANIRRFLNGSAMPPQDAVRIEEMVNYFDYSYAQPTGEHPFSVNTELATCPWNSGHYLLSIGIKGKDLNVEKLPANNIVFLMDVSGSMSDENKLPLLKESFKVLLEGLRPVDKVAMVVYAGNAGLVLPSTSCDEKDKIIAALDKLEAGGSTAGGEGITLAYKVAKENFIAGGNNRVILATDGDFNVGPSSDGELERLIEEKRKDGIFLTILGFGMGNYKDSKMEKLSNAGNGNYAYIDNILEAKKTLGKEIWGTLYTIAKDVKLQLEFNPAKVKGYRLVGYENRMLRSEDFNDDQKDAGDIGAGHTVTAFYEIIPTSSNETIPGVDNLEYQKVTVVDSENLLTLKLRYKKPDEDVSKLIVHKVKDQPVSIPSANFLFATSVAEFGLLLRDSKFKGTASYKTVTQRAKLAIGDDPDGYRHEFIRLVAMAEALDK